jgi:prevent-host-death family protein
MSDPDISPPLADFMRWDQQQAKAKFSEVVRRARAEGPQLVTTRGANPVVVMSAKDYLSLAEHRPTSFNDLLLPGDDFEPVRADAPTEYEPFTL